MLITPEQLHQPIGIIGNDAIHAQVSHNLHVRLFIDSPGQDQDLVVMGFLHQVRVDQRIIGAVNSRIKAQVGYIFFKTFFIPDINKLI